MTDAAQHLADEPRVSADMRYRINAFGHELVGSGRYLQLSAGAEKLVRLELRVQVGEKTATVQEIRGLDTFWVRRDVPPAAPTLGRVDLKQLRRSQAATAAAPAADVLPQGDWIMLGGLTRLMLTLEESFDFAPPRSEELQFNAPDGKGVVRLPIWRLEGKWKAQRLAALLGHKLNAGDALPEQLPDRVELVLGRNEEVLPLFPYRITYSKTPPTDPRSNAPAPEPQEMLMLELFNVSRRPIDSREFDYQPGDQHYDELTPQYARRLGGEGKTR